MQVLSEPLVDPTPGTAISSDKIYLPKLDGLRAVSIALVLVEHFYSQKYGAGGIGVTIFFVISGFLITSILFTYAEEFSVKKAALTFYWRRTLRLFPVYYFCIAAGTALNVAGMRKVWLFSALYMMNVKLALDHAWNGSSHFWSLAVEEQFYVLWFFIIVMVPRRYLLKTIILFILLAQLWRLMIASIGASLFWNLLLPGAMDSLAMGALVAYYTRYSPQSKPWILFLRLRIWLLLISTVLVIFAMNVGQQTFIPSIFLGTLWSLFSVCLVSFGIEPEKDWRFDWLRNKALRHFGKISYGIYVYHYFVPVIFWHWSQGLHTGSMPRYIRFLAFSLVSWWVAELSWHFLEKPFLKLKDKTPFWIHEAAANASAAPLNH
jgi:peptidoglycan/LPS O-acetylase OafA/YrhL